VTRSGSTKLPCLLLLMLYLAMPGPALASLNASLDRYTISMGETARLTLSSDGEVDPGDADLDALEEKFEVLQRSSSVSTQILNGERTQRRELVLEITPRREGNLIIPAFSIGRERSEALAVTVRPQADLSSGDEVVLFEAELDREQVYVQGQVLLTLRVQQAVNLESRSITELEIDNAFVKNLGQNSFQRTVDGRPWLVHELRYAIFPEASGELRIPPQTFSGRLSSGRRSLFDTRSAGRLLRRSTGELVVDVMPRPPAYPADTVWLPAAKVEVEEQWSTSPESLRVGDSVTRSITVTGDGLQGAQLPPQTLDAPEGLRVYPDQPVINDIDGENGVTGIRTDSAALVAVKAGNYDLPPITVTWWDSNEDRQREITLPGKRLRVVSAGAAADSSLPGSSAPLPESNAASDPAPATLWWPWLTAACALGWLLTALGWWTGWRGWRDSGGAPAAATPAGTAPPSAKTLLSACQRGDAAAAEAALRRWLRERGFRGTLDDWAALQRDPRAVGAVSALQQARYGAPSAPWDGSSLAEVVRTAQRASERESASSALPPLYPATG
jgi:hypothetical protein